MLYLGAGTRKRCETGDFSPSWVMHQSLSLKLSSYAPRIKLKDLGSFCVNFDILPPVEVSSLEASLFRI